MLRNKAELNGECFHLVPSQRQIAQNFSEDPYRGTGAWHLTQPATHIPRLSSKKVRLNRPMRIDESYCTAIIPDVEAGRSTICIIAPYYSTASQSFASVSEYLSTRRDSLQEDLNTCGLKNPSPSITRLRACAKIKSPDSQLYRDLPFVFSSTLPVLPAPRNLEATMSGVLIMAAWNLAGQSETGQPSQIENLAFNICLGRVTASPLHRVSRWPKWHVCP